MMTEHFNITSAEQKYNTGAFVLCGTLDLLA
jgi:hypothetical protein